MVIDKNLIFSKIFVLIFTLFSFGKAYDFPTQPTCQKSSKIQSPIPILSQKTTFYQQNYFRIVQNNYTNIDLSVGWSNLPNDKAIGIVPPAGQTSFGPMIIMKDWALYQFDLTKILFRYGSEHTIDNIKYDVEMQLIHSINNTYRSPGRYISLGDVSTLVVSIFFVNGNLTLQDNSLLFNFTNFTYFANQQIANPTKTIPNTFSRAFKLRTIVQHAPGYNYVGTTTSSPCNKALYFLFPQYHLIPNDMLTLMKNLYNALGYLDSATGTNTRDLQLDQNVVVYRNYDQLSRLLIEKNKLQYTKTNALQISYAMIVFVVISAINFLG